MKKVKVKTTLPLTKGLKIAAIYFIVVGGGGLLMLLMPGPNYQDSQALSFATKLGQYTREGLINIFFLVSGIGLLIQKLWAKKMALIILVIGAIYTSSAFAWGFSRGKPSIAIWIFSLFVVCLWNGMWFYIVYKAKPSHKAVEIG